MNFPYFRIIRIPGYLPGIFQTMDDELSQFDPFSGVSFNEKASRLYQIQLKKSEILSRFAGKVFPNTPDYGFFPAEFFTRQSIYLGFHPPHLVFTSSGTSGNQTAQHQVADSAVYNQSLLAGFDLAFPGFSISRPVILALLPNYLERTGSSLVHMVQVWMKTFGHPDSGFYLNNFSELIQKIDSIVEQGKPLLIIGVTYALLDFFVLFPRYLPDSTLLIETGGMKGRKAEMIRPEVHALLKKNTGLSRIASEYGMTELLSQAYSADGGRFRTPPWMRVEIRDLNDVTRLVPNGKTGRICIVDLANKWSCAFIATGDVGRKYADETFEVLGRADAAGSRGCSLLYTG